MNLSIIKHYLVILLLIITLSSCNDTVVSSIPDYPVYLALNLTTTYPTFRNSINQYLIFKKATYVTDMVGYGGILVYTDLMGEYCAFDLSCPYEAVRTTRVVPNDVGHAVCEGCGSVFNISDGIGEPLSGLAKQTLKRYKATLSGDVLYITAN
jgi:nitrite reductase/ring-hydroxylating ferredoxin subunit